MFVRVSLTNTGTNRSQRPYIPIRTYITRSFTSMPFFGHSGYIDMHSDYFYFANKNYFLKIITAVLPPEEVRTQSPPLSFDSGGFGKFSKFRNTCVSTKTKTFYPHRKCQTKVNKVIFAQQ